MTLQDFEKEIGAERFDMCMESKDPYWIINYHAPLSFNQSYSEQVGKNPLLTVIARQDDSEILAVFCPATSWSVKYLSQEIYSIKRRMDVIFNSGTDPSDA